MLGGVLGPTGLREAVGSGGVTTWVTSYPSASIESGTLWRKEWSALPLVRLCPHTRG